MLPPGGWPFPPLARLHLRLVFFFKISDRMSHFFLSFRCPVFLLPFLERIFFVLPPFRSSQPDAFFFSRIAKYFDFPSPPRPRESFTLHLFCSFAEHCAPHLLFAKASLPFGTLFCSPPFYRVVHLPLFHKSLSTSGLRLHPRCPSSPFGTSPSFAPRPVASGSRRRFRRFLCVLFQGDRLSIFPRCLRAFPIVSFSSSPRINRFFLSFFSLCPLPRLNLSALTPSLAFVPPPFRR